MTALTIGRHVRSSTTPTGALNCHLLNLIESHVRPFKAKCWTLTAAALRVDARRQRAIALHRYTLVMTNQSLPYTAYRTPYEILRILGSRVDT